MLLCCWGKIEFKFPIMNKKKKIIGFQTKREVRGRVGGAV